MIHIHTSQTSKNSCSIVISHPYYTSFTPTYIVVVVTVAVVTVVTYIHITIVCPILFTNLSSLLALQSHIPTYIHTLLLSLLSQLLHTYHSCCCSWCLCRGMQIFTTAHWSIKAVKLFIKSNLDFVPPHVLRIYFIPNKIKAEYLNPIHIRG